MLESYIRRRLREKEILLMTHIVLGHPDLDQSMRTVEKMVEAGVDLMELQIPFSEPIADGPVILRANQSALARGVRVRQCFEFARKATQTFGIPFLFMTYYNILFKTGVQNFAARMVECGLKGAIVPDLPHEEGEEYLRAMKTRDLAPIFLFSPTTGDPRMKTIASLARGFIYCVARKGVTGMETRFSDSLDSYLARCRNATDLPLALGFGIKGKDDVDYLRGKVDIAVIGSQIIRLIENEGVDAVSGFIRGLT